jgi:hypothetical protein
VRDLERQQRKAVVMQLLALVQDFRFYTIKTRSTNGLKITPYIKVMQRQN